MNLMVGDVENNGKSAKMAGTSSVGVSESQGAHHRTKPNAGLDYWTSPAHNPDFGPNCSPVQQKFSSNHSSELNISITNCTYHQRMCLHLNVEQHKQILTGTIIIATIYVQYTTLLIMTEPEAFTHNASSEKAHWSDGEITVLINHMYDHCAESKGGGNFKTSVYNSTADAINGDPILQAS